MSSRAPRQMVRQPRPNSHPASTDACKNARWSDAALLPNAWAIPDGGAGVHRVGRWALQQLHHRGTPRQGIVEAVQGIEIVGLGARRCGEQ
jgi:hypothetical protein